MMKIQGLDLEDGRGLIHVVFANDVEQIRFLRVWRMLHDESERLQQLESTPDHLSQVLNEGDGVYRP